jgi:hypothetical protein
MGQICAQINHLRWKEKYLAKWESDVFNNEILLSERSKSILRKEKNLAAREKTFERREAMFAQKHVVLQTNLSKLKTDEDNLRLQRAKFEKQNALVTEQFITQCETVCLMRSDTSKLLKRKLSVDNQVSELKLKQEKLNREKSVLDSLRLKVGKASLAYKTRLINIYARFRDACQAKRLENLNDVEGTCICIV